MIVSAARKFTLRPIPSDSLPADADLKELSTSHFSSLMLSGDHHHVYKFIFKRVTEFTPWHEAEIMAAACASSAYICPLLGFTETSKFFILKMPYYKASDLLNYMNDNNLDYLPLDKALLYSTQLMRAISFLHANRVAHRDIKLDNIMLSDDLMSIKLGDFGFAVAMFGAGGGHIGSKHPNIGTMKYLSPELIEKFMKDAAAKEEDSVIEEKMFYSGDVWAAGASMYAMYTGDYLFDIEDLEDDSPPEKEAVYQAQVRSIADLQRQGLWIKDLFANLSKKKKSLLERSPAFENVIRNSLVTRWTMRPLAPRLQQDLVEIQ